MKKGLLIGNPVDKSISHITHNEIFRKCNIACTYEKKIICLDTLAGEVELLKKMDYSYIAVTMPLKEVIIPFLDKQSKLIGSVNTIEIRDGKWVGHNFDGIGCLNAIEKTEKVAGKKVLVLGAGGAAKAAVYEASARGAEVFIYNRTKERALLIAKQFGVQAIAEISSTFDVIIQATSVGMFCQELPMEMKWVSSNTMVMEMIYNPMKTLFVMEAQKKGARVILGYEMFAELSYAQFNFIFGDQVDKNIVHQEIRNFFIKN